jgi:hypothetical protein
MRKLNATVLGLITAAIAVVGGNMIADNPEAHWNKCDRVEAGEVSQGHWNSLRDQGGWFGVEGDSMEALWSPACTDEDIMWFVDTNEG